MRLAVEGLNDGDNPLEAVSRHDAGDFHFVSGAQKGVLRRFRAFLGSRRPGAQNAAESNMGANKNLQMGLVRHRKLRREAISIMKVAQCPLPSALGRSRAAAMARPHRHAKWR